MNIKYLSYLIIYKKIKLNKKYKIKRSLNKFKFYINTIIIKIIYIIINNN